MHVEILRNLHCLSRRQDDHGLHRIEELRKAAGINQFNIYLMSGNEEETIVEYGKNVIERDCWAYN